MRLLHFGATGLALCIAACTPAEQKTAAPAPAVAAGPSLEGVWKRVEVVVPEGQPNAGTHTTDVQPSLEIFTKSHYSIVFVQSYAPRPALSDKPTDAEQLAAFQPFGATSGTYKLDGATLTLTAIVAKSPNGMTGQPNANPIVIEWAGDDVWFTVTNVNGTSYRSRLVRVAD